MVLSYEVLPRIAGYFPSFGFPFILAGQSEYYGFEVASFSGGSSLRVEVSTLDGGTNLFTFFDEFRYVIIPGGQAAGKSTQDLQKMSYEEVTKVFNIK